MLADTRASISGDGKAVPSATRRSSQSIEGVEGFEIVPLEQDRVDDPGPGQERPGILPGPREEVQRPLERGAALRGIPHLGADGGPVEQPRVARAEILGQGEDPLPQSVGAPLPGEGRRLLSDNPAHAPEVAAPPQEVDGVHGLPGILEARCG